MTFLNPFILVALAAASIPLLLHLLNLRKLRTVEFSSLRFLKELQKTRIRRLKLKQILLLLLRIGLVVFAVLAFARPALQSAAGLPGSHAATTAVILIDDSFSMGVRDDEGTRFKQAQLAAGEIVDLLEESDEAYLLSMTDLKRGLEGEPSRSRESLHRRIDEMKIGYRRADLDDALRAAASLLDRSENINKELYIITDAQRVNSAGRIDSLRIFTEATRVYLLPIGVDDAVGGVNLGLDSIRVLSSVFEQEKPVEVRAWVRNYGDRPVDNVAVSMYVGESRLAQGSISVAPGKTQSIDLSAPPRSGGMVNGRIEISGDDFDADNKRYFAFRVLQGMRLAIIAPPDESRYLGMVTGLARNAITSETFPASSLPTVDLAKYSTVILSNVPNVSGGDGTKLIDYVQGGGGLVIYGGPSVDYNSYNSALGGTFGFGIGTPVGDPAATEGGMTFAFVDKGHPLFAGVFDPLTSGGTVETPLMKRVLPASGGESIIRLSNGLPFMSEYRYGRGRVIYIAAPPTTAWGDLPLKGIFVPIAIRSALYVGATGEAYVQTTVGESVNVPLPPRATLPDQVKIISPDGRDRFVPVRKLPAGASVAYDSTGTPGVYRVESNGETLALFTANMASGESDLTPMKEEQLKAIVGSKMINPANLSILKSTGGDFEEAVVESRFGLELWKYMLALALLCAFTEMLVGRTPKEGVVSA